MRVGRRGGRERVGWERSGGDGELLRRWVVRYSSLLASQGLFDSAGDDTTLWTDWCI